MHAFAKGAARASGLICAGLFEELVATGLAQTAAGCSLRSRRDLYFEITEIARDGDSESRICASPGQFWIRRTSQVSCPKP